MSKDAGKPIRILILFLYILFDSEVEYLLGKEPLDEYAVANTKPLVPCLLCSDESSERFRLH